MTTATNRPGSRLAALAIGLIGLVLLTVGLGWGVSTWMFVRGAHPATATVKWVTASEPDFKAFRPTMVFTDENGDQHVAQTGLASSEYNYAPGAQVEILYNLSFSDNVRIVGLTTSWKPGAVLAFAGLAILSWLRRKSRRPADLPSPTTQQAPAQAKPAYSPWEKTASVKPATASRPAPPAQPAAPTVRRMR
jgi:hypothetical protein